MTAVTQDVAAGTARALRLIDHTMLTISELHNELAARLCGAGPVSIDCSEVQRPTTAMLQLLAAFAQEMRAASRQIDWYGENESFDRAAKALGLSASLGLVAG